MSTIYKHYFEMSTTKK